MKLKSLPVLRQVDQGTEIEWHLNDGYPLRHSSNLCSWCGKAVPLPAIFWHLGSNELLLHRDCAARLISALAKDLVDDV